MSPKKTILLFLSIPFMVIGFLAPWYWLFDTMMQPKISIAPTVVREVSWNAVGDIMLSRTVAQKIKNSGNPLLPFEKIGDVLLQSDFNFGNIETPITSGANIGKPGVMVFNTPESYASGLREYNFSVLTLANNHAFDQGREGLFATIDYLRDQGIQVTGVGENLQQAWMPKIVEKNGIKICFIGVSYSSINDNGTARNDYIARMDQLSFMQTSLLESKKLCEFSIIALHAGVEYTREPTRAQRDFARAAIDAGADMVLGAHPHWIQTIERYCPQGNTCEEPKYIFYSLGNFIFDQEFSQDTKEGLMLNIVFQTESTGGIVQKKSQIQLIPVVIENYSTPRIATSLESASILAKIGESETFLK